MPLLQGMMSLPQPGTSTDTAQIIMKTRFMRTQIINDLKLKEKWKLSLEDALDYLAKNTRIKAGDAGDMRIEYTDNNAQVAYEVLRKSLALLEKQAKDLTLDPADRYINFVESARADAELDFTTALTKLQRFLESQQGITPSNSGDLLSKAYFDVESNLSTAEVDLHAKEAAVKQLSDLAIKMVNKNIDPNGGATTSSVLSKLYSDLIEAQTQLQLLRRQYSDTWPDVVSARRTIEETQKQMESEVRRLLSGMGAGENPFVARDIVVALAARTTVEGLKGVRDRLKEKLAKLPGAGTAFVHLQLELDAAKAKVVQLRTEAGKAQLYKETRSRVFVIPEPPIVPVEPNPRGLLMKTVIGLLLGLLIGCILPYSKWSKANPRPPAPAPPSGLA
jgi:uncharacterized protein involved in exopolysaccharide biosynthesis